jgi:hypothetical protein
MELLKYWWPIIAAIIPFVFIRVSRYYKKKKIENALYDLSVNEGSKWFSISEISIQANLSIESVKKHIDQSDKIIKDNSMDGWALRKRKPEPELYNW